MEGSAPGPASTSIDPKIAEQNGAPSPLNDVPAPGTPGNLPPAGPPQMHPVESVLMAEMQATQAMVKKAMALNRTLSLALFCVGLACIYYLSGKLKAKMPLAPSDIVPSASVL